MGTSTGSPPRPARGPTAAAAASAREAAAGRARPEVVIRHVAAELGDPFAAPVPPGALVAAIAALCDDLDLAERVRGRTVLLKPNLNFLAGALRPHAMVDPRLVMTLGAELRRRGAARVLLGEKPGQRRAASEVLALLTRHFQLPPGVEWIDFDVAPRREVATGTGLVATCVAVPSVWLEADVVIGLAKAKTHTLTEVSLGVKNLFGLLTDAERLRHHNEDLHPKLCDLLSIRAPDVSIIDALVGHEGQGPLFGRPRPLGLLVAGTDTVAVDATAASIMGFAVGEVEHLRLAAAHGLGEGRLEALAFPGLHPDAVRTPFARPDLWANPVPGVEVVRGAEVPAGYANAVSHSLERLAAEGRAPAPTRVFVGRGPAGRLPAGAVVFGDVTARAVDTNGTLVIPGHPPRAFDLYDALVRAPAGATTRGA